MDAATLAETLSAQSLLAGCAPEELADIAARGTVRSFKPGTSIILQGDPGDTLWIVLSGLARVSMVAANGREIVLDYAERGAVLGEIAFLDGGERTATVEAIEPVDALGLTRAAFAEIVGKHQGLAMRLLQAMARRLRQNNTVIEADDEVFFIAAKNDIRAVMSELRRLEHNYKRVVIAGGGNIGYRLAKSIQHRYNVKIIERSPARAEWLGEKLQHTVVLQGPGTDRDELLKANIENTDVFCALTNDDEANIMASLLAKRLGARKVMTLIANPAYVDLVQGHDIDIAISPQQSTIGSLLTHVRRGDVVNVYSLRRGAAEAIEAIAHGGASPAIARTIAAAMAGALGNASIDVIEGATHAMLVSHPAEVAAVIAAPARSEAT